MDGRPGRFGRGAFFIFYATLPIKGSVLAGVPVSTRPANRSSRPLLCRAHLSG